MKNFILKGLLFVVSSSFFVFMTHAVVKKPWTFLVYIAAANDLHSQVPCLMQEMAQVGSNENVNILVYLTVQQDGRLKHTQRLYVEQGALKRVGERMVRDSGDSATLTEALQWAHTDYPSDHCAVVLWGKGSGPLNRSEISSNNKGVCYDFDTEHYLTDRDCLQAFSWARDNVRGGKKIDVIAFDASFLASLEMAYMLSSCADYMIASEENVPGIGYQYAYLLNECSMNRLDPLSFALSMLQGYSQDDLDATDYMVSVTDLNALQPLVDNCNAVAQILTSQLKGKHKDLVKSVIKKCIQINSCSSFDKRGIYVDMCQLYRNLLKNIIDLKLSQSMIEQFRETLTAGIELFAKKVIKGQMTSKKYERVGGLSIYFSRYSLDPSYYGLYWTEKNPNWLNFLEAYLS